MTVISQVIMLVAMDRQRMELAREIRLELIYMHI